MAVRNHVDSALIDLYPLGSNTPEWVVAKELKVDHRYQREIDPAQVNKIAAEFDPDLLGGLIVSQRPNGDKVVLDGQTRLMSIRKMRYDDQRLPCFVHRNLTPEREAYIFEKTNTNRRGMNPYAIWRSQLFRNDPQATSIKKVLDGLGLHFSHGNTKSPSAVRAIVTVRQIYEALGDVGLHRVMRILRNAWRTQEAYDRNLIHGVAIMVTSYPQVTDDTLIRRLQASDPGAVLRKAVGMKGTHGDNIASYAAFELVDLYNKRARSADRLPIKGTAELGLALRGLRGGISVYQTRNADLEAPYPYKNAKSKKEK